MIEKLCHLLELAPFFEKPVGELSGGYKRILSIAIALVGSASLIVLDEPTANLDLQGRLKVWQVINKIKKESTIIIAT